MKAILFILLVSLFSVQCTIQDQEARIKELETLLHEARENLVQLQVGTQGQQKVISTRTTNYKQLHGEFLIFSGMDNDIDFIESMYIVKHIEAQLKKLGITNNKNMAGIYIGRPKERIGEMSQVHIDNIKDILKNKRKVYFLNFKNADYCNRLAQLEICPKLDGLHGTSFTFCYSADEDFNVEENINAKNLKLLAKYLNE